MIAVLFAEQYGNYYGLPDIDPWGIDRDARKYKGIDPVIAHPPCQKWGKMARVNYARWGGEHNKPAADGGCFSSALASVLKNGGVLEHPAQTYAWKVFEITKPSKGIWKRCSTYKNAWVCEVWQSAYGHKANKATWLLYVGKKKPFDMRWDRPRGTHQVGFQDQRGKARNKPTLSKKEANATPIEFRNELIKLAIHSTPLRV